MVGVEVGVQPLGIPFENSLFGNYELVDRVLRKLDVDFFGGLVVLGVVRGGFRTEVLGIVIEDCAQ